MDWLSKFCTDNKEKQKPPTFVVAVVILRGYKDSNKIRGH